MKRLKAWSKKKLGGRYWKILLIPVDYFVAMGIYFIIVSFVLGGRASLEESMVPFGVFCGLVFFQVISNFWFRESVGFFFWIWLIGGLLFIALMAIGAKEVQGGGYNAAVVFLIAVVGGWFAGLGLRTIWWGMFGEPHVHHGH